MMKITKTMIFCLFVLGANGCEATSKEKFMQSADLPFNPSYKIEIMQKQMSGEPDMVKEFGLHGSGMDALEQFCSSQIDVEWNSATRECECIESQQSVIVGLDQKSNCQPVVSSGLDSINGDNQKVVTRSWYGPNSRLNIRVSLSEKLFSKPFDENLLSFLNSDRLMFSMNNLLDSPGLSVFLQVGKPNGSSFKADISMMQTHITVPESPAFKYARGYLYEPDVAIESILYALGLKNGIRPSHPLPINVNSLSPRALGLLYEIYDLYYRGHSFLDSVSGNCLVQCKVKTIINLGSKLVRAGYSANLYKNYYFGIPDAGRIEIQQHQNPEIIGAIVLNFGGGVSHYLINDIYGSISSPEGTNSKLIALDRNWVLLLDSTKKIVDFKQSKWLQNVIRFEQQAPPLTALICDGPMAVRDMDTVFNRDHFRLPLSNEQLSLSGWAKNLQDSVYLENDIFVDNDFIDLSKVDGHSLTVARTYISYIKTVKRSLSKGHRLQKVDGYYSHLNMHLCSSYPHLWLDKVINSEIKVINLSFAAFIDKRSCEDDPLGKVITKTKNDLLWIAAAGNNRIKNPEEVCPGNLGVLSNLLVVTDYFGKFNFGRKYADITILLSKDELGSSQAAPKVTALAAILNEMYLNLSPYEVRMAILLGAKIERKYNMGKATFYPLPVRSGGVVDVESTLKVAEIINKVKSSRGEKYSFKNQIHFLLTQVYKHSYEVDFRMKWLRGSELI